MNNATVTPSLQYDCAGILCGNCRNGYGLSVLLNKCVTCPDASGIFIAVLGESQNIDSILQFSCFMAECNFGFTVLLDALVLISLMLLVKVFPAWLYPCLFYLQVSCA